MRPARLLRPPAENAFGRDPCANCGNGTHAWWSCTARTETPLNAHFAAIVQNKGGGKDKGKGKGKDPAGKGKGRGYGRGYGSQNAQVADRAPEAPAGPGKKKRKKAQASAGR